MTCRDPAGGSPGAGIGGAAAAAAAARRCWRARTRGGVGEGGLRERGRTGERGTVWGGWAKRWACLCCGLDDAGVCALTREGVGGGRGGVISFMHSVQSFEPVLCWCDVLSDTLIRYNDACGSPREAAYVEVTRDGDARDTF